jgi:Na+/H+ antiporter NhaD/arsenite permease-like protein
VLVVSLCLLTGVISAFLDNVTTMLLIAPVSVRLSLFLSPSLAFSRSPSAQFKLATVINIDPVPLLLCEVLYSNIGGTATLIGDPPNIIIAEQLELGFGDFIKALSPCVLLIMAAMGACNGRERGATNILSHTWIASQCRSCCFGTARSSA